MIYVICRGKSLEGLLLYPEIKQTTFCSPCTYSYQSIFELVSLQSCLKFKNINNQNNQSNAHIAFYLTHMMAGHSTKCNRCDKIMWETWECWLFKLPSYLGHYVNFYIRKIRFQGLCSQHWGHLTLCNSFVEEDYCSNMSFVLTRSKPEVHDYKVNTFLWHSLY